MNRFGYNIVFYLITIILIIGLLMLGINPLLSWLLTVITVLTLYIVISFHRHKKRINLLEEYCDPEAFLIQTAKQRKITGKNKRINAAFDIDEAAGLMSLGKYQEALIVLDCIDISHLSTKNGILLAYYINLIGCYHELDEKEKAIDLFDNKISTLSPINKRLVTAIEIMIIEKYYAEENYIKAKEKLSLLLKSPYLSTRQKISLIYILALINEQEGYIEDAHKNFQYVIDNGNKLGLVEQSKLHMQEANE
ncbi:hypothetical protein AN1V17_14110 [Vallitalea sediminicola]